MEKKNIKTFSDWIEFLLFITPLDNNLATLPDAVSQNNILFFKYQAIIYKNKANKIDQFKCVQLVCND